MKQERPAATLNICRDTPIIGLEPAILTLQHEGMGIVTAPLQISNPRRCDLPVIEVSALADTGSVFLCIPEHVRLQLDLDVQEQREHRFRHLQARGLNSLPLALRGPS